jgi:transposase-like protein
MIRLFTALCKTLLDKISEEQLFFDSMDGFNPYSTSCPHCGAVGRFSDYGDYERGLVSYDDGDYVDIRVRPHRVKCLSCRRTHALLPETLTPYSPYALYFKLLVLIAYFERGTTVVDICEAYGIAVSTLYEWKKLMIEHKDFMLGVLISRKTSAMTFLNGLLESDNISDTLHRFFNNCGFSFMQATSVSAAHSIPP